MTTHRTDKTTQHKKENLKPKRNIYRIERDAFYMHQVTQCVENPVLKKSKPKEYKITLFSVKLNKSFFIFKLQ